jgi:hypothetical protein
VGKTYAVGKVKDAGAEGKTIAGEKNNRKEVFNAAKC